MFLKALEIQGFKSFPDRTRVSFDKGITAVVGPNGSGKSNISDALRWVMGETSIKQLRGGGKMENVIFGGTQKRNAMGYASVQLVLDNSDRRLDVDADEVAIGRKYYRSGESEYSVNGQSVRLRDVYELLLDTGLGRDGYSMIGQGRIAEIVGAKSAERREIFEEASGIARYRYRKNEAERRLLSTEDNLVRLRDILGELEGRVGPLGKESDKAKKFLEFSAKRKSLEVTLWVDTVRATRETLRKQQRNIEIAEADYAAKGEEVEAIYEGTQGIRGQIERVIVEIDRANGEIQTLQEEIAGYDARLAVLQNDTGHNEDSISSLQEEMSQSGESTEEITAEIAVHHAQMALLEEEKAVACKKIAGLENRLGQIQSQSLATGERRGEVQAQLAEMTDRVTSLRVQEASAVSSVQSAERRLEEETVAAGEYDEQLNNLQHQKDDTQSFLDKTQEVLRKLENIRGGLEMKLGARTKALQEVDDAERSAMRALEAAEQRLTMLKELENSLDGYQASVKNVVKAGRAGRLRGIIGPVSSILSVKQGYEVAVETALGYSLQNIVVADEAAAKAAMTYLKESNGGRATFLPLDTVKPAHMDASRLPSGAVSAKTLVEYDTRYENIVSSLLARIVAVSTINDASRAARTLDYRNRIVTQDGQIINAGGSFTGGSVSRSAGLFSRKQEMEELSVKMTDLRFARDEAIAQTQRVKAEVAALSAEQTATGSEAITAGGDKIRCETELARIGQAMATAQNAQDAIAAESALLHEKLAGARTECTLAKNEQARLQKEIEDYAKELEAIVGSDDSFLSVRETMSFDLSELRLAALGLERDIEAHEQKVETLQSRTGEGEARRALLQNNLQRLQELNAENSQKTQTVQDEAKGAKAKIEEVRVTIARLSTGRLEKEGSITQQTARERALSAEREELGREIARLSEQKTTLAEKYDGTISQLWEEYQLTLADAEGMCAEFSSVAELRRNVAEVRAAIRALGHVNVGAIEEFEEVNERYGFLKKQVDDVEKSKAELEKMIAELSAEMTVLFGKSFEDINQNFGRVFVELFGGGSGQLVLSDPENLLESGIEIEVTPPGKIIKDLSALSGGEQALVAICIYFAILAVNPAPFCVLDEIEAALDDVNVVRYAQYLRRITARTQFILITHRRGTMEEANVLYGVTMQEDGVSKLLRLNVADVDATLVI